MIITKKENHFRYFRVIPASEFLKDFASDRRHMKRPDGTWIKPPPNYPPISTACKEKKYYKNLQINKVFLWCGIFFSFFLASTHNLEEYIQMDISKGPGRVFNLTQFVQHFYKPAT